MRRASIVVTAALMSTLALTAAGCEDGREQSLRLGIECHEAGGEWVYKQPAQSGGYTEYCKFENKKVEP